MNVLFDDIGQLEVDDSLDAGDVETSGGDVGRQEDVDLLVFEAPEISVGWEIFHQILFRNLEALFSNLAWKGSILLLAAYIRQLSKLNGEPSYAKLQHLISDE